MTVRVEINGPMPATGEQWCFTCMAQYMGQLTESDEWQEAVKKQRAKAEEEGKSVVVIFVPGPSVTGGRLNEACTTGTSYWAPGFPTPVCWSHIQGIKPDEMLYAEMEQRVKQTRGVPGGLIPGKKYEVPNDGRFAGN